ncbi:MAG: DEAD/DEAH box helicase [Hyphomicrobiales bacterium]|nr:DEAD/DEAH box helicase [Hyphomicrobiales bacterium]
MTTFQDLGLSETVLRALSHEGYRTPTPIQSGAIPPLLQGRDLLGIAQTGTGKTAAFACPIVDRLVAENRRPEPRCVRALVLAPTRELAQQIAESFKTYGKFARLSVAVIVGGVSAGPQAQALARGLDVLVATPGRLLDHLGNGALRLASTRIVVLDEADHMLDLGFIEPIKRIVSKLPADRQTLLFSATMPKEIAGLADAMLREPARVSVTPVATTVERIDQRVVLCESSAKRGLLLELLGRPEFSRAIVFTRTKRGADRVSDYLGEGGVSAVAIHGNKSQGQRQRALESFRRGQARVLVATDIAARGIDIDGISHVINFEMPDVPEAYVHRIGRTARAGADGSAISLVDGSERDQLRAIERLTRQSLPIEDRRTGREDFPAAKREQRGPRNAQQRPHGQPQQRPHGQAQQRPHGQAQARPQGGRDRRPLASASRVDRAGSRNG